MTNGEFIYFTLVLIAFVGFGASLAYVSWWSGRNRNQ